MARICGGIALPQRRSLPLYGADVGLADMSEVLEGVKAQGETALHAFKARAKAAGVSVEGRLDARHERGVSSRLRLHLRAMSISPLSASRATAIR